MNSLVRSLQRAAAAAATFVLVAFSSLARAQVEAADGTAFVRGVGAAILGTLGDPALSRADREERLRAIYRDSFDRTGIAARIVGRGWRHATDVRRNELTELFEAYFARMLDARLAKLAGAEFRVLISEPEGEGVMVYTTLVMAAPAATCTSNGAWRNRKARSPSST